MTMKRILLVLFVVCFCMIGVLFFFKKMLKESKCAATFGSVSAINAAFSEELHGFNPALEEFARYNGHEWKFLATKEYDMVINELAKRHNLDPSPENSSQPLLDLWGNRYEIAFRKLDAKIFDSVVVSKGPDGVYRTEDDVVNPHGASEPVKPTEE